MKSAGELEGRVAPITGAAKNIGRAIAEELAEAGAAVVINTRSSKREAEVAAEALELVQRNINVNYLAPGPVNTVREVPARIDAGEIPMGRFAEIAEVTQVVRMLCSRKGRYITGQTIHVNGGFYMNA